MLSYKNLDIYLYLGGANSSKVVNNINLRTKYFLILK